MGGTGFRTGTMTVAYAYAAYAYVNINVSYKNEKIKKRYPSIHSWYLWKIMVLNFRDFH